MSRPRARYIRPLLLVAVNLLLTFIVLEVALRVQEPVFHLMSWRYRDSPNYRYVVVDHPVWDHQLRADLEGFQLLVRGNPPDEDFAFLMRTNSWGCRYPEVAVPRPSDRFRVIVMGDSFTEGYYEEDSVASHLERALDAKGLPVDFEVMNCGVSSFSGLTILLRLRDQLLAAEPDVVLVNFDLTDLYDDYFRRRRDLREDADGRPLGVGPEGRGTGTIRDWGDRQSYAVRAFTAYSRLSERMFKHWLRDMFRDEEEHGAENLLATIGDRYRMHANQPGAAEEFETAWRFFAPYLDRLIDLCHEAGVRCAFSSYPHEPQLSPDGEPPPIHRGFQERLAAHLAARGEMFYDAHDAVAEAYAEDPSIFLVGDMHYSPLGQRAWGRAYADAFAPWILEGVDSR